MKYMESVKARFGKDEITMATTLLLFVTYYPAYPPLKCFTKLIFRERRDYITIVEDDGVWVFTDIEDCTKGQIGFFKEKIKELPGFSSTITKENNLTRFSIFPAER